MCPIASVEALFFDGGHGGGGHGGGGVEKIHEFSLLTYF